MQSVLLNVFQFQSKRFAWPQDSDKKDKVVELYVANDYSQVKLWLLQLPCLYPTMYDITLSKVYRCGIVSQSGIQMEAIIVDAFLFLYSPYKIIMLRVDISGSSDVQG